MTPDADPNSLALPHPDWLAQGLTITGPAERIAAFRTAAAGPGVIPWREDHHLREADWVARLLAEGSLTAHAARIEARRMTDALQALELRRSLPVPLDLHLLLPVPARILRLGPGHKDALAWLWEHWGTTWPLRHVEDLHPDSSDRAVFRFWSADWPPWQAVLRLRQAWPELSLSLTSRTGANAAS